jgi:hypothetical protein
MPALQQQRVPHLARGHTPPLLGYLCRRRPNLPAQLTRIRSSWTARPPSLTLPATLLRGRSGICCAESLTQLLRSFATTYAVFAALAHPQRRRRGRPPVWLHGAVFPYLCQMPKNCRLRAMTPRFLVCQFTDFPYLSSFAARGGFLQTIWPYPSPEPVAVASDNAADAPSSNS